MAGFIFVPTFKWSSDQQCIVIASATRVFAAEHGNAAPANSATVEFRPQGHLPPIVKTIKNIYLFKYDGQEAEYAEVKAAAFDQFNKTRDTILSTLSAETQLAIVGDISGDDYFLAKEAQLPVTPVMQRHRAALERPRAASPRSMAPPPDMIRHYSSEGHEVRTNRGFHRCNACAARTLPPLSSSNKPTPA